MSTRAVPRVVSSFPPQERSHLPAFRHRVDHARARPATAPAEPRAVCPAGGSTRNVRPAASSAHLRGRPCASTLPSMQHDDVLAAVGFIQIRRAQQHGQPLLVHELQNDLPQFAARQRIDADGRLVEQQQFRRADQRAGQPQLLLHAAGELARQAIGERPRCGHLHQLADNAAAVSARDAVHIGIEIEVLLHASDLRTDRIAAACSRCAIASVADRRPRRCPARAVRRRRRSAGR